MVFQPIMLIGHIEDMVVGIFDILIDKEVSVLQTIGVVAKYNTISHTKSCHSLTWECGRSNAIEKAYLCSELVLCASW